MLSENKIKVSVIIPCRNEEKFIGKCLDSIISNEYPKDKLEVLVIDGMSEDGTRKIVEEYTNKNLLFKLIDNPKRIVPTAMNIGIKNAKGDIIIRMDAHNVYEKNYISQCVQCLNDFNVDNVGGAWATLPGNNTIIAESIALALSHPFGVGNAYFRIGSKEPRYVDTVPFGCYKRNVFDKIGLFNENLVRNQDIEFNLRLKNIGGKLLLIPEIISYYYARSTLKGLFEQNFWNGFWVIYSVKFAKIPFSIRHLIPFIFVSSLILSFVGSLFFKPLVYLFLIILNSYFISNIFFSFRIALKKGFEYFFPLIASFVTLHFSYGLGSMRGMIELIVFRRT